MTNEEINKYIHLEIVHGEKCINRWGAELNGYFDEKCSKCGEDYEKHLSRDTTIPDYCSDDSPRSLLNEVVKKMHLLPITHNVYRRTLNDLLVATIPPDDSLLTQFLVPTAEQIARSCVAAWQAK